MSLPRSERPVILIAEDEFLIRLATADAIREAGFEVLEASDTDQAISILEARSDVRVVFTDVHMPGSMDGAKLAHAVKGSLAAGPYHCDLGPRATRGTRFAGWHHLDPEAIQPKARYLDTSSAHWP